MHSLVTVSEVVDALQISERRVRQLVSEGVLPKEARSKYDLDACLSAYEQYKAVDDVKPEDGGPDLEQEKTRLTKAQADLAELKYAVERRELAPIAEVERMWGAEVTRARAAILTLPVRIAGLVSTGDAARVEAEARSIVYQCLRELTSGV